VGSEHLAERIIRLLEPRAAEHGLEIVAVESAGGRKQPIVRVFLDREGGIDIEAISGANRWISEAFDEEPPIDGPYTLEVSSPGIDRPLRKRSDYERFVGQTAHIGMRQPIDGRGAFTGVLRGVAGDDVVLDVDGEETHLPLSLISKARLKAEIDFSKLESPNDGTTDKATRDDHSTNDHEGGEV